MRRFYYYFRRLFCNMFTKKFLFFIIFVLLIFIFSTYSFGATPTNVNSIADEIRYCQEDRQDLFAMHCLRPYINDTDYWKNDLKPIFDYMINQQTYISISPNITASNSTFRVYLYKPNTYDSYGIAQYSARYFNGSFDMNRFTYNSLPCYNVVFYPSSNSGTLTMTSGQFNVWYPEYGVTSPLLEEFIDLYCSGSSDYSSLLALINTKLENIYSVDSDILNSMDAILDVLDNLPTSDYSQDISDISGQISDILEDNQTIIEQNEEMLEEAQNISSEISNLNDKIENSDLDSNIIDLPTDETEDITSDGVNNIFNLLYTGFCEGSAEDIVIPVPFTGKSFTIEPDFLSNILEDTSFAFVLDIIKAFYWYVISAFIIKDISKKIDKIKSGNFEDIQNTNIKEDML